VKEALKIDLSGNIVDVELVADDAPDITHIYEPDPDNPDEQVHVSSYITKRVPEGTYKPIWDSSLEDWTEGLTPEEIEAIRNAPVPKTPEQLRIEQLETESVETMLAVSEVYETATAANADREQESVDTMLGLAEAYELILIQQGLIEALSARIDALESAAGGE